MRKAISDQYLEWSKSNHFQVWLSGAMFLVRYPCQVHHQESKEEDFHFKNPPFCPHVAFSRNASIDFGGSAFLLGHSASARSQHQLFLALLQAAWKFSRALARCAQWSSACVGMRCSARVVSSERTCYPRRSPHNSSRPRHRKGRQKKWPCHQFRGSYESS